ncbi:MAG: hypothetical protein AABY32_01890 [Nanoarchaeota archaeon]
MKKIKKNKTLTALEVYKKQRKPMAPGSFSFVDKKKKNNILSCRKWKGE